MIVVDPNRFYSAYPRCRLSTSTLVQGTLLGLTASIFIAHSKIHLERSSVPLEVDSDSVLLGVAVSCCECMRDFFERLAERQRHFYGTFPKEY